MFITLKRKVTGLIFGVSLALSAVASAEPADLLFAAAPTGSTWYAYAGALHSAMLKGLPQGSSVAVMNTPMAIANTKLLAGERADIGMIFPPVANWAMQGFGPFDSKVENVRGLVGGMDRYYQRITVQNDSPIKSLADIKEQELAVRIGTGPRGSLNEYIARLILQSYGLSYEDIESLGGSVAMNSFGVLRNQFGDNQLDMIIGITTPGHPNTAQLSIAPGHRFLSLNDESVAYLKEYGFSPATMPANTFEGQNEPVEGVGFPTSLYARKALSDEHAYQITKGIMESRKSLKQQFGSMDNWEAEESAKQENLQMPLHPGAEQYYREAGIIQ